VTGVRAVSVRSLMDEAEARAGTDEWGSLSFTAALGLLLDSCAETAALTPGGWDVLRRTMLRHLGNRLALQPHLAPRESGTTGNLALVVTGLPRTGTTLVHNLLAQDPGWRYVRLWEALRPAGCAGARSVAERSRVEHELVSQAEAWLARFDALVPGFGAIHPTTAVGPEECDTLLQNSFASLHFDDMWSAEAYSRWLWGSALDDEYHYYALQLGVIASGDELSRPWLLKSPGHLGHLEALAKALPDAVVLWCHRHPVEAVASWASLIRAVRSPHTHRLDEVALGRQALSRAWTITERALQARKSLGTTFQLLDVSYSCLLTDPIGAVGKVYAILDRPLPPEALSAAQRWLAENPQHRRGRHVYGLEEFSLSAGQVTERFAPYLEGFGELVGI
jgi:hypothetical protein